MEDSTLTTIEFLRARLLSERSASKTAKQKADELAQRVVELEKQLISVSLERKKAEKESEEVLTILENNGISEFMEALDSSSDEEQILVESGQHTTNSSKESSTLPIGRSLSWKSNNDNSSSGEKRSTDRARRREGRFLYTSGSSSKPRLGKSCRQIKRMDLRSPADGVDDESLQLYSPANGLDTGSGNISGHYENSPKSSETGLENEAEEDSAECVESDLLEYRSEGTSASVNVNGSDAGLENELGNQTKLIGWYEAEEIAQTEWEEKFREDGSCTPLLLITVCPVVLMGFIL
ncbi:hypothetical protein MKW94_021345, partial [Papaver nudicaule]|nr:hypothetical protein [Papaver nudicaule]